MTPRRKPARQRRATDGGSRIALAARLGRPGGTHDRRRKPRAPERARAIREAS